MNIKDKENKLVITVYRKNKDGSITQIDTSKRNHFRLYK